MIVEAIARFVDWWVGTMERIMDRIDELEQARDAREIAAARAQVEEVRRAEDR